MIIVFIISIYTTYYYFIMNNLLPQEYEIYKKLFLQTAVNNEMRRIGSYQKLDFTFNGSEVIVSLNHKGAHHKLLQWEINNALIIPEKEGELKIRQEFLDEVKSNYSAAILQNIFNPPHLVKKIPPKQSQCFQQSSTLMEQPEINIRQTVEGPATFSPEIIVKYICRLIELDYPNINFNVEKRGTNFLMNCQLDNKHFKAFDKFNDKNKIETLINEFQKAIGPLSKEILNAINEEIEAINPPDRTFDRY